MNKLKAIKLTTAAITVIVCRIFSSPLDSFEFPLKAAATFPITSEIEGKMAPAATAAKVPNPSRSLSVSVRY
jgi:hypothetical protein